MLDINQSNEDHYLLLDVSRLVWRAWRGQLPTGIDRACLAYVEHFHHRALAVVQRGGVTRVLSFVASQRLFSTLLDSHGTVNHRRVGLLACLAFSKSVPRTTLSRSIYFNVGHTGLDRTGHVRWVTRMRTRVIYCIYDLIPVTHPDFARKGQPKTHALRMLTALSNASGIIGISEYCIATLREFAQVNDLPMPPALCAPLAGTSPPPQDDVSCPVAKPYFVTVGTIEGRKNHLLLLRVWRRLIEQMGEGAPALVIIGQRGWCADDVFRQLDTDPVLRGHVFELGRCDDAELHRYLVHAQALLFPSFVEGQGLPLIEALAAGTPVIASDLAVFRETAGTIPDYIDPTDDEQWLETILRYVNPASGARAAQSARMTGFRAPTWEDHFAKVEVWLAELGLAIGAKDHSTAK